MLKFVKKTKDLHSDIESASSSFSGTGAETIRFSLMKGSAYIGTAACGRYATGHFQTLKLVSMASDEHKRAAYKSLSVEIADQADLADKISRQLSKCEHSVAKIGVEVFRDHRDRLSEIKSEFEMVSKKYPGSEVFEVANLDIYDEIVEASGR